MKSSLFYMAVPISLLLVSGCGARTGRPDYLLFASVPVEPGGNSLQSCPFLTRDPGGRLVLSWVSQTGEEGAGRLYYARSADGGKSFSAPVPVPTAIRIEPHGENLPRMILTKNGEQIALFGSSHPIPGNAYAGMIYYTLSRNRGRTWSPARSISSDTGSYDQRYFDAAALGNGAIGFSWLNNSTASGSTLLFAQMDSSGRIQAPVQVAAHTCQCCRTDLFLDSSGRLNLSWRGITDDSIRDMEYSASRNQGATWSSPVRISPDNWVVFGCPHTGPSMTADHGRLFFSWYTMGGGGGIYCCSKNPDGAGFTPRMTVSRNPSSRHPQMITLEGGRMVICWDELLTVGNRNCRGIALQVRDSAGAFRSNVFICPRHGDASFPVVAPVSSHSVLLAYTVADGNLSRVLYRIIPL